MKIEKMIKYLLYTVLLLSFLGCDKTEIKTDLDINYEVEISNDKTVISGDTMDVKVRINNPYNSPLEVNVWTKKGDGKLFYKEKEVSKLENIRTNFSLKYVSNKYEDVNICMTVRDGYSSEEKETKEYCTSFKVLFGSLDLQLTIPNDTVYLNENMKFILNYLNPNATKGSIRFRKVSYPQSSNFRLEQSNEVYFDIDYDLDSGLYEYSMTGDKEGLYKIAYEANIEGYNGVSNEVEIYMRGYELNAALLEEFSLESTSAIIGDTVEVIAVYENLDNLESSMLKYDGVGTFLLDGVELLKGKEYDISKGVLTYKYEKTGIVLGSVTVSGVKFPFKFEVEAKELPLPYLESCKVTLLENGTRKILVELGAIIDSGDEQYVDLQIEGYNFQYETSNKVYQLTIPNVIKRGDEYKIHLITNDGKRGRGYSDKIR